MRHYSEEAAKYVPSCQYRRSIALFTIATRQTLRRIVIDLCRERVSCTL